MKEKFDWKASTSEAESVLEGSYNNNNEELDEILKLVLNNSIRISLENKVVPQITVQDLKGKMKV